MDPGKGVKRASAVQRSAVVYVISWTFFGVTGAAARGTSSLSLPSRKGGRGDRNYGTCIKF